MCPTCHQSERVLIQQELEAKHQVSTDHFVLWAHSFPALVNVGAEGNYSPPHGMEPKFVIENENLVDKPSEFLVLLDINGLLGQR